MVFCFSVYLPFLRETNAILQNIQQEMALSRKRSREILVEKGKNLIPLEDRELFQEAWKTARSDHGSDFTFYLPGMIRYGLERGRYPAISITGHECELMCKHCMGQLLKPMIKVTEPQALIKKCNSLNRSKYFGILLSGGSDPKGRLPWQKYYSAIKKIRDETSLYISAHVGLPDQQTCFRLKEIGINQALIDVMGDNHTASEICNLDSLKPVIHALNNIKKADLPLIPHIVSGLYYGKMKTEYQALEIIRQYTPTALVIVVLNPLKGTSMAHVTPPSPLEVGRLIAKARLMMPKIPISLGCERPRTREGKLLEKLAIRAGANRMALWSENAVDEALRLGLRPRFQLTCCSLDFKEDFSKSVSPSSEFNSG